MKVLVVVVGLLVIGFLIMLAYLYLNQRRMMYFPQPLDRTLLHVRENVAHEVVIQRKQGALHGWLLNTESSRLIIYYGGNGEEVSWNIDSFKMIEGHAILLMNFRGFGESSGSPTEAGLVEDALAIFDQKAGEYERIILMGRSLGSGIAVQVASQRKIDRLILVTPYDSILSIAQSLYPWAPVSLFIKDPYDSVEASKGVSAPALILVAEFDEVIPERHSRNLAKDWSSDLKWISIEGASHNSIADFPQYWAAIKSFLNRD